MLTLEHYDRAIEVLRKPVKDPVVNEMFESVVVMVETFKQNQINIARELLTMYESASEHNIDVSRVAIFELAKRLLDE